MKKEIAVLLAAGLGSRMYPLTETIPKPLIKIKDQPMIETMIAGLKRRQIEEIYVVVGYRKEQFTYLTQKYPGLRLIENQEYLDKNNISSVFAVSDIIKDHDCFICESDVYLSDPSVFDRILERSCYFGKMVEGHSADWLFDLDENQRLVHIHKGGINQYNMVGITYLRQEDACILSKAIKTAYDKEGHEKLFWDEIVDTILDEIDMTIQPVSKEQLTEIDTVEELRVIDPSYYD